MTTTSPFKGIVRCASKADYDSITSKDPDKLYIVDNEGYSYVTGIGDGIYWQAITIDGVTYAIPQGGQGVSSFNDLTDRPKYKNASMTSATNIPDVPSSFLYTIILQSGTDPYYEGSISLVDTDLAVLSQINPIRYYISVGQNTDGSMTQKAISDALDTKADSSSLASVATSGSYGDLSNKPTIPSNTSDLTNDSLVGDVKIDGSSVVDSNKVAQISTTSNYSGSNPLTTQDFVNSSIATNTSYFRGTFNIVTDLNLSTSSTSAQVATALSTKVSVVTNNDYSFVSIPKSDSETTIIERYDRYKYASSTGSWSYEYSLNNSSFTSAQWNAINSGLSSTDKTKLDGIASGAQVNVLETVKVNGTAQTIANKAVNITMPTALADLTNDSTHRTVTDTEKATWNAKQAALVSGTNIMTINSTSLLGSGNIAVQKVITYGTADPSGGSDGDIYIKYEA